MRVIYVTSSLPYGPGEAFIIPEIQELQRLGHQVLVVPMYPRGAVFHAEARSLLEVTRTQPLVSGEVIWTALRVFARQPIKSLTALTILRGSRSLRVLAKNVAVYPKSLWLAFLARAWRADHIHAHWAATTATMALVASEMSGVPWSFTAHRWDIAENNLLAVKARRATFARAIDRRGGQELAALASLDDWQPQVIHVGVALPATTARTRAFLVGDCLRIIMAANFVGIKGHVHLVEAIRLLRQGGAPVRVDLVGDGPLREAIELKVQDHGLRDEIRFLGVVAHERLLAQLEAGAWDVMVLPSIEDSAGGREGIPVSLMEAMACGIPAVSTLTGGIPELLQDGAGLLVPPGDAPALANALRRLAQEDMLRVRLGEAGRERIEMSFRLETVVSDLAGCFLRCEGVTQVRPVGRGQ
jgi:colanic acid/amylovoran biosynthesis glycosyltransferase